ncbi:MAG TPA: VOC family protein [Candidatus Eisenbacteria bacterium]|nr:VOC family protein [Candidatus Eisenbacteria bacterium]
MSKQKITPCLWFDNNAEEAVNFYTSVFKHSKIHKVMRYGEAGPGAEGSVMTISFQIEGQDFLALNGGPQFKFNEAISLIVNCEDQKEVDELWTKLTQDGGQESQCGWLKDKFGMSWQITPKALIEMVQDKDPEKAQRVFRAMLGMKKIQIDELEEAYEGAKAR